MKKSMETIDIRVDQGHIDRGVVCSNDSCPVALAMADHGLQSPRVGPYGATFVREWDVWTIFFPLEVQRFVKNFDGNKTVAPTEFKVEAIRNNDFEGEL